MDSKTKKIILIAGLIVVVLIVVYFFFLRKPKTALPTKTTPSSPYDFDYTIPREMEDGIVPTDVGGNGTVTKVQLTGKQAFDGKVKAVINQIMNGAPDNTWYQAIQASTGKYWTDESGMDMNQAVYHHARVFIAKQYFYLP